MRKVTPRDFLILLAMVLVGCVIGVFIGRYGFKRPIPEPQFLEDPRYKRISDSLYDVITMSRKREDSLVSEIHKKDLELENNKLKVTNEVRKIHNFNDTTRTRFRDSVKLANGIK